MLAEIGHFILIAGLLAAIAQTVLIMTGLRARDPGVHALARMSAYIQFALVAAAFVILTWLFIVSDFSVLLVFSNSHTLKPLIYKITGVWGNHEGSLLLWMVMMTGYTALLAALSKGLPQRLISRTIGIQTGITALFLAFMVLTSNPFARLWPPQPDGQGLNPLLQDPGLASHPPLLYAGYVGFSICFAFAVAALIEKRADAIWARIVRPWALSAWIFLTVGIALGSNWAYYELGWGGWWAWDPVENASLLPWLAGTALIHSLRVMEKRDTLKSWTLLLAILTFSLSLLGTFLVRSGVITSVHAFAVDASRGVFILGILAICVGGSLVLFAIRASLLKPGGTFKPVSRESVLLINNVVLAALTGLVLVGTYYELFVRVLTESRVTVQAPFYNLAFNSIAGLLLITLPVSTLLAWKRGRLKRALKQLIPAALAALVIGAAGYALGQGYRISGALGLGLAVWIMIGVLTDLRQRIKLGEIAFGASWSRALNLPASLWGNIIAHFGLGVLILGMTGSGAWVLDQARYMQPGDEMEFGRRTIAFDSVQMIEAENYIAEATTFAVRTGNGPARMITAERRLYNPSGMQTTEAGIRAKLNGDLYITVGERQEGLGWPVHLRFFPLAALLWFGSGLIALGGVIGLADGGRRKLAARKSAPARGSGAVAAEPAE